MQIFKQWPIYLIGRILPAAIGFSGIAVYTRMLDPASFGIYALLLSTSFLIGMVGFSWLRVATLRIMASIAPADEPDFAATIAISFAGVSILVAAATIGALRISAPAIPLSSEVLTAAGAIASGFFELNVSVAQARMHLITYGLLQAARAVGALVSSVLLILAGLKANALLGGFAIGNGASLLYFSPWRPALGGTFRVEILCQLFHFGWPSSAASLTYFTTTFQRFVLAVAGGSAAVGVFAAASDFSQQTVGLLIGTAMIAGQPLAFRARDLGTPHELSEQLRNNARLVFGVGLSATAGLIALSVPLAHLYFGPKFQTNAALLLAISAAAVFLSGLRGYYFEQAFEITRNTRPMAITAGLRIVMTLVLSTLLISRWAAVGAGLATLITEIFGLGLSVVWARQLMHVPVPLGSFAKIVAATAAMVCVLELMPSRSGLWGLILSVLVGILTYAVSIAVMHRRQCYALFGMHQPVAELTRT